MQVLKNFQGKTDVKLTLNVMQCMTLKHATTVRVKGGCFKHRDLLGLPICMSRLGKVSLVHRTFFDEDVEDQLVVEAFFFLCTISVWNRSSESQEEAQIMTHRTVSCGSNLKLYRGAIRLLRFK